MPTAALGPEEITAVFGAAAPRRRTSFTRSHDFPGAGLTCVFISESILYTRPDARVDLPAPDAESHGLTRR
jgi:hypothetical protein